MSKPVENARWIWSDSDDASATNVVRTFRREVDVLADEPLERVAFVTACDRYELIVNGRSVAGGPAPSARRIQTYDRVDLELAPGPNSVVAIVAFAGVPVFSRHRKRPGFLFAMGDVVSDASWLVARRSAWEPAPRLSEQLGFAEYQDARRIPVNVFRGEIDPAQWTAAAVLASAEEDKFGALEQADIPMPSRTAVRARFAQMIGCGNCESEPSGDVAARLRGEDILPLSAGAVAECADGTIEVAPDGRDIWLVLDMGREVSGTVDVDVEMDGAENAGAQVDIGYDEAIRPGETPSGMLHGDDSGKMSYADRLTLGEGRSPFASFAPRAFRYARLVFRGLKAPIRVTGFGVHELAYPVARRGVFACSDGRLDRIFEIGRRTALLCSEDRFMDCPSRERAQWIADARIQAIAARYCFGDSALHRRFLRQIALSQHPDGRLDPVGPGDWDVLQPNNPIPGFVALYIESVLDYFHLSGDAGLIAEVMPAVQRALGWLASHGAGEGGLLADLPGWNFTDWAPGLDNEDGGIGAAANLFYLQALRAAALLAEHVGDEAAGASYRTRAEMIAAAFDSLFWNALRGVYVDSVASGGVQSGMASQQVNTLALLADVGSEARRLSAVDRLFADRTLTQIGSPYFSFYLVRALAACGKHMRALDYIRKHWGAMMDAGATSWWEKWSGKESRCHAWSVAPNIWLPQEILGVCAHEPGFACVGIAPKPCDLAWARGMVPIPQGDVFVSWVRTEGRMTLDVSVPAGVHLRPILPCAPTDRIVVDGEPVADDAVVRRDLHCAELAVLPGSGYRFETIRSAN